MRYKVRKGFSLIELLIVILIVSMVYFLGFDGFSFDKPKPKPLTPLNLKPEIQNAKLFEGEATLMCLDACRTCYIRRGISSEFEPYPHAIDLKNPKVYKIGANNELLRMEFGRYNDKEICLVMDFYHNGSNSQLILENDEGAYLISAFFNESLSFESPQDAKEYLENKRQPLTDAGAFY